MAKKTTKKNRVAVLFDDALKKEVDAIAKNKQLPVSIFFTLDDCFFNLGSGRVRIFKTGI